MYLDTDEYILIITNNVSHDSKDFCKKPKPHSVICIQCYLRCTQSVHIPRMPSEDLTKIAKISTAITNNKGESGHPSHTPWLIIEIFDEMNPSFITLWLLYSKWILWRIRNPNSHFSATALMNSHFTLSKAFLPLTKKKIEVSYPD